MIKPIDKEEAHDLVRGYARRFVIAHAAERRAAKQLDVAARDFGEARDIAEKFLTPTQIRLIIENVENMGSDNV